MTTYVTLLRGIGPNNPNMRNKKLREVCEALGLHKARSVISSGNIIFESTKSANELEQMLDAAWPDKLGFNSITIVRSQSDIKALCAKNPFKGYQHQPKTYLNVTFFRTRLPKTTTSFKAGYQILKQYDRELCSVVDTTTTKTPTLMTDLEKKYGKIMTTRTWKTVERIFHTMQHEQKI